MDYRAQIGQKILSSDGAVGVLSDVNEQGYIKADFEDNLYEGYFMFDPFLEGRFQFLDPLLQREIDDQIAAIRHKQEELIQSIKAISPDQETYYVTLENGDGMLEKVLSLNCNKEQAFEAFRYVVDCQAIEYRKPGVNIKWRQVRLWDVKTGRHIAQES